jgi:hypothetical protein
MQLISPGAHNANVCIVWGYWGKDEQDIKSQREGSYLAAIVVLKSHKLY